MKRFAKMALGVLIVLLLMPSTFAMSNPAAVYCEELGYKYEIKRTEKGDVGLCVLPNGEKVDAWDFLRGKVAKEYSYCARNGYEMKTVKDESFCMRIFSDECSVCIVDGEEVEVTDLMNLSFEETVCGDGTCGFPENYKSCPEDCPSGGIDEYCDGVKDGKCDPDCSPEQDPDCAVEATTPITTTTPPTPGFEAALTIIAFLVVMCIMSWRKKMR